jgi:hypothetical protein
MARGVMLSGRFVGRVYKFQEFQRLVANSFDRAVYYTARSYERELALAGGHRESQADS